MVRFVDANVFLYAYLKPKRKLKRHEAEIKKHAKNIVYKINKGEEVILSLIHI